MVLMSNETKLFLFTSSFNLGRLWLCEEQRKLGFPVPAVTVAAVAMRRWLNSSREPPRKGALIHECQSSNSERLIDPWES
jgi:hypothetical protein